jgi:hypothetical protein
MDQVHGDHHKKAAALFPADLEIISPTEVIQTLRLSKNVDSLIGVQLIGIGSRAVYQISFTQTNAQPTYSPLRYIQLADARTGKLLPPLSEEEAVDLARQKYHGAAAVAEVEYLTELNNHHEYRENPLPAFAVTFADASHTTVYVAAELGTVQKFRNQEWRVFDFLWMLHTMDYQSRDNFGNILLKAFSVLGLVTILSGFLLYFFSSPTIRRFEKRLSKRKLRPALSSDNKH